MLYVKDLPIMRQNIKHLKKHRHVSRCSPDVVFMVASFVIVKADTRLAILSTHYFLRAALVFYSISKNTGAALPLNQLTAGKFSGIFGGNILHLHIAIEFSTG